ncbi:NF041680 family putative transposase [Leekyejoonella antrihumi]|nr:NF041680 family putative transposase [Leekyejoonella antrihumi]
MSTRRSRLATAIPPVVTLTEFRSRFHRSLTSWGDALFELTDAILCAPAPVVSVPGLSLEPVFRRSHGSLYKALDQGRVDADALRDLLAKDRPPDWPLVFAVDASTWARCDAETSPERGFYYSASKHSAGKPIVAGWSYQWVTGLDWANDSWTAPMDARRISPADDAVRVTTDQARDLVDRLGHTEATPVFVSDAGYDAPALTHELTDVRADLVVRIRDDRVFYTDPPERQPGTRGLPRRHGDRVKLSKPDTWPAPDQTLTAEDSRYGAVNVTAWHGLHPELGRRGHWTDLEQLPIVCGTIIRVEVEHLPKPTSRTKKTLWLWAAGPDLDLDVCWRAYLRRFDIEHGFRFVKNTLGWTTPALRTPEQADRWTWPILAAYTQLRLARTLVADLRLPWERRRPPGRLTPARVRRGFRRLATTLGTPASPPKSRSPGHGRPKGTSKPPRTRYPAIKKAA